MLAITPNHFIYLIMIFLFFSAIKIIVSILKFLVDNFAVIVFIICVGYIVYFYREQIPIFNESSNIVDSIVYQFTYKIQETINAIFNNSG